MPIVILDASLERPGWLSRSVFTQTLKNAFWDLGLFWSKKLLRKHFTAAGGREYRYKERSPRHMRRKQRKFGHADPLVWGRAPLKRELLRRSGVRISSTSKGVRIRLRPPKRFTGRYAQQYSKELTSVSERDRRRLQLHLVNSMRKRMALYEAVLVTGRR